MTNEALDMSGNPMDQPFHCDQCGKHIREEDSCGIPGDPDKLFCSDKCANEFIDERANP